MKQVKKIGEKGLKLEGEEMTPVEKVCVCSGKGFFPLTDLNFDVTVLFTALILFYRDQFTL